jgi:hypothetical protein
MFSLPISQNGASSSILALFFCGAAILYCFIANRLASRQLRSQK